MLAILALVSAAAASGGSGTASTLVIPAPASNPKSWFKADDIPRDEFDAGNDGSFFIQAVVNSSGVVEQCKAKSSSAGEADRNAFCDLFKRRAKYNRIANQAGGSTYYVVEENYTYILPEAWYRNAHPQLPMFVFDVKSLPGAKDGKLGVVVNVAVDEQGALKRCEVPSDAGSASLARLACSQLPTAWEAMPLKNGAGQPVAYVRQLTVEFRQPSAKG